jgi:tetratricopeptide (TPR) repeat protein
MDYTTLIFAQATENEKSGDWQGAEILYRGLLRDQPDHGEALRALGFLLLRRGALRDAETILCRAVSKNPCHMKSVMTLGQVRQTLGLRDKALQTFLLAACLQAVAIAPSDVEARFQLGLALHQAGFADEAGRAFRQAIAFRPDFDELYNNLGISLQTRLLNKDAIDAHRRAVAIAPRNGGHHSNLAHALLAAGCFAEGFSEWEWRTPSPPREFTKPKWDGSPYPGRTLLAHAEQGYGDTLQFSRYLSKAARLGGRLIVECRAPLSGILARIEGVAAVIPWGEALPPFDAHIPIPSLPHALSRQDPDADIFAPEFAAPVPYVEPSPDRLGIWRQRTRDPRVRIGLVCAGNAAGHDPKRAIPPQELLPLAANPDIALFSLQRDGRPDADTATGIVDLGPHIGDFEDLAAAIASVDLLISVDTAAAHLAGAMGHPVWCLLHASPDWRWQNVIAENEDPVPTSRGSAWYPSMRLFRQEIPGDWREVIGRVAMHLPPK